MISLDDQLVALSDEFEKTISTDNALLVIEQVPAFISKINFCMNSVESDIQRIKLFILKSGMIQYERSFKDIPVDQELIPWAREAARIVRGCLMDLAKTEFEISSTSIFSEFIDLFKSNDNQLH